MANENNLNKQDATQVKNETVHELVERHLADENHTTTDEEIRNATLDLNEAPDADQPINDLFEVDNSTVIPPIPGEPTPTDDEDKEIEGDQSTDVPNPYDILK